MTVNHPVSVAEKTCVKCGETKPAADFYANKRNADGLGSNCRTCHQALNTAAQQRRRHKTVRVPKPATAVDGGSWQDKAACRDLSLDLFFGPEGERAAAREVREEKAKQVCAMCAAETECLEESLGRGDASGVFGGLNPDERRSERRRRQRRAA